MVYLSNKQVAQFLRETSDCRDYAYDAKPVDLMYALGVMTGRLDLMADLLSDHYEDKDKDND